MIKLWRRLYWRIFYKRFVLYAIGRMNILLSYPLTVEVAFNGEEEFVKKGQKEFNLYINSISEKLVDDIKKALNGECVRTWKTDIEVCEELASEL